MESRNNSDSHPTPMCLNVRHGCLSFCTLGRSIQHGIAHCPGFVEIDLTRQVRLLVEDRAGLPSRKGRPLVGLPPRWMNDAVSENKNPSGFPWSQKFAKEVALQGGGQYIDRLQAEFNKADDRSTLPGDESTRTIKDVYINL